MRSTFIVAALAAVVAAQSSTSTAGAADSTGVIPACILSCWTRALPAAGCTSMTELDCICTSMTFQDTSNLCVRQNCPAQFENATKAQESLCPAQSPSSGNAKR